MTSGILLINKPLDWTSFDVVNYVRKIVATAEHKKPKQIKVGHTGTLDPLATGLLVLLIGEYTKRAVDLSKVDKTYDIKLRLGEVSTTGDGEGKLSNVSAKQPTRQELNVVLSKFTGSIMQTPPAYSAVKINGQRAYNLARAGKTVEIEPRPVTVYSIDDVAYDYPNASITAVVSSGTYIRSLVEDIGRELGVGAYMTGLCRTIVGEYRVSDALDVQHLDMAAINSGLKAIA